MMFNENASVEDNTEEMTQAIAEVKSGTSNLCCS